MILRSHSVSRAAGLDAEPEPAFQIFLRSQKEAADPLPVLQSAHGHLAGELAAELLPDVFGPLPEPVIEAIRQHDYGWIRSDLQQLESGARPLRAFPELSPAEATAIWHDSIRLAESASPLAGALVSRHFCTLAQDMGDAAHVAFEEQETARRLELERHLPQASADLERWTAAVGFCDLLSLYLCCGSPEPAELPLCHPADRAARSRAGKVILRWQADEVCLEPRLFPTRTRLAQYVMAAPARSGAGRSAARDALTLEWLFA